MRTSGQSVEISSGAATDIAKKMGLIEALNARGTGELGLNFVDDTGNTICSFEMDKLHGRSFTSEHEILRSDLIDILYQQTKSDVEYRFGEYITEISETESTVGLTFSNGRKENADLLIICDGLYSSTRKLANFQDVNIKSLGQTTAYFTIENQVIDLEDKWAKWYNDIPGCTLLIRPDSTGKNTRAYLSMMETFPEFRSSNQAAQKALITQKFQGKGYVVDRVVAGMQTSEDFYVSELAQVRCKTWSSGRVVLCGDAAYCPSPISGMGTDCAIIGAYVLAGEIAASPADYAAAFARYDTAVRPFIESAQNIPGGLIEMLNPRTSRGLKILRWVLWLLWKSRFFPLIQSLPDFSFLNRNGYRLRTYSWD